MDATTQHRVPVFQNDAQCEVGDSLCEKYVRVVQSQLQHKNPTTTMQYDQVPVEDRRDALNRMG